jgi:hypothetical protein
MEKKPPKITKKQLLPFIKKAWREVRAYLDKQKANPGPNKKYVTRNQFELMQSNFCDPATEPEKFFDEYMLCLNKVSKQSSGIRGAIICVGRMAVDMCLEKKDKERNKRKQKKEETTKTE